MTTIIFDLDGTLIDAASLVLPAFREAIRHFSDQPLPSNETMEKTFGMPENEIWQTIMPDTDFALRAQVGAMTDALIHERMITTDVLMPDTKLVLAALQARGHILTTASNCGQRYLDGILDTQGIRHFFMHPLCLGTVHGQEKADILKVHFDHFDRAKCVMVGDRKSDVDAAKRYGIPVIGCTFGFGDKKELSEATTLIHSLKDLLSLFPET